MYPTNVKTKYIKHSAKSIFEKIPSRLVAVILMLTLALGIFCAGVSASDGEGNISIVMTAPEIQSGISMVKLSNGEKYIRYVIILNESQTCFYSEISCTVEYDGSILSLYSVNTQAATNNAYTMASAYSTKKSTSGISYAAPVVSGNRVSCSVSASNGMGFLDGKVFILYFSARNNTKLGDVGKITISNFKATPINSDRTPLNGGYTLSTKDGSLTLTEEGGYIVGDIVDRSEETSPIVAKAQGEPETAAEEETPGFFENNKTLAIIIVIIIVILIIIVSYLGIRLLVKMIMNTRRPKEKDVEGNNKKSKTKKDKKAAAAEESGAETDAPEISSGEK